MRKHLFYLGLIIICCAPTVFAQIQFSSQQFDNDKRSLARVDPVTLALNIKIPIKDHSGRAGNSFPVEMNYSSRLWRIDYMGTFEYGWIPDINYYSCLAPIYGENSQSGWTNTLSIPMISLEGAAYDTSGNPADLTNCQNTGGACYRNDNLNVKMPDGSSIEFRARETVINTNTASGPFPKTYYAVDGSGVKFIEENFNHTGNLLSPNGSHYRFTNGSGTEYTDPNGNKHTYNNGNWNDTLGRPITFPSNYVKRVKKLSDPGVKTVPGAQPYTGDGTCNYQGYPTHNNALFTRIGAPIMQGFPFDPDVLHELELPDGTKYTFTYNQYGEIDKIVYPTGAYEKFTYDVVAGIQTMDEAYAQTNRGVVHHIYNPTGNQADEQSWTYSGGGSVTTIIGSDGTKTENIYYPSRAAANPYNMKLGLDDARVGQLKEQKIYKRKPDNSYEMASRKLYELTMDLTATQAYDPQSQTTATRNSRVVKEVGIQFLPGSTEALATFQTYEHQIANHTINVTAANSYGFVTLSRYDGETILIGDSRFNPTNDKLIERVETAYGQDANYINRNMTKLPTSSAVKKIVGDSLQTVAQTEISYDELSLLAHGGDAGNWQDPNTAYRGNATTSRVWNSDTNTWLETKTQYDQLGNVRKTWDANSSANLIDAKATEYEYSNAYKNAYPTLIKTPVPDPSGQRGSSQKLTTSSTFDFNRGLLLSQTDANGATTTFEYNDPLDRQTKITAPDNLGMTVTEYGNIANPSTRYQKVKTRIDLNSWAEAVIWHDAAMRVVKTQKKDIAGDVFQETIYDEFGRVKKVSNPYRTNEAVKWTENNYDYWGQLKKVVHPKTGSETVAAEVVTDTTFQTSGSVIGVLSLSKDEAGNKRIGLIDRNGHLREVWEIKPYDVNNPDSELQNVSFPGHSDVTHAYKTSYEYDSLNNLKKVFQGQQTRTFIYDGLSRLKSANNPESGLINYTYDNNGNLLTKTDARTITTTYTYDALSRVTFRDYSDSTPDVIYSYDNLPNAKGKLTKVTNGQSSGGVIANPFSITEYQQFDLVGRVLKSQQITDGAAYPEMTYTYNLSGALVEQKYPSGRVVKNVLDNEGNLSIVQSKKNQTAGFWNYADNFTYTAAGAIKSVQLGNGRWESTQFNSRLQPTQIALGTVKNATDKLKLDYEYGTVNLGTGQIIAGTNNGNVGKQTITVPTEVRNSTTYIGFSATQYYAYDSLNRLQSAAENFTPQNQSMYQTWRQTFQYDRYGNRRFDTNGTNTTTLTTNCAVTVCNPQIDSNTNKLIGYQFDASGNVTRDAQNRKFTYDGENKQTKVETVDSNGNVIATLGQYFYDGDGKRVKKYVPGTGETTVFIYDASGKLMAENSTLPSQTQTVGYLTTDHLGSPRINTDQNGNITARHDYQPFGEEIARASYGADTNRKQFTSYERDKETDLDFAQARIYYYKLGKFMSIDPSAKSVIKTDPQSWNKYSYVYNRPLSLVDTNGKWPTGTHNKLTRYAFKGLTTNEIANIDRGNLITDVVSDGKPMSTLWPSEAHKHAITEEGSTKEQATGKANSFLQEKMDRAQKLQEIWEKEGNKGISGDALAQLGEAIHTYQDATSPSHGFEKTYSIPTKTVIIKTPDGVTLEVPAIDIAKYKKDMDAHTEEESGEPTPDNYATSALYSRAFFLVAFGETQFNRLDMTDEERKAARSLAQSVNQGKEFKK